MTPLLELENIWVNRHKKVILQDISLTINSNQIVTVIGPNGAGKTTLVKVLLGAILPTKGSVKKLKDTLNIGYVPQRLKINPNLPLRTKDFLKLSLGDFSHQDYPFFEDLQVIQLFSRPLHSLSGGELQKIMLASALARKPDILILDEPEQGIDIEGQKELYRLLDHACHTNKCGILLVSHDLHLVMAKSDVVYCINTHMCCSGHPSSIQNQEDYKKLFGQNKKGWTEPPLAPYEHHHDHRH